MRIMTENRKLQKSNIRGCSSQYHQNSRLIVMGIIAILYTTILNVPRLTLSDDMTVKIDFDRYAICYLITFYRTFLLR